MAVRGVYTEAEQKILDGINQNMESLMGWYKSPEPMVATEESMKNYAYAVDPKNPLWRDENYARNTRWGSIIAVPEFVERIGVSPFLVMPSLEYGYRYILIGNDDEYFKPIRANDSFRVWRRRGVIKDVTSLDGKGPRTFAVTVEDFDIINQKDELVSNFKHLFQITFFPDPPKPYSMPDYGYTKEELAYIDRMEEDEEIRGANIRFWEDVNAGDDLKPVVMGPVTRSHMIALDIAQHSGRSGLQLFSMFNMAPTGEVMPPNRASLRDFEQDPATGLYYYLGMPHWDDRAAQTYGEPRAFLYSAQSRHLLARLITNWMGDDGFIRKYHYRHMSRNHLGETLIGHGKVVNKHIENGEYLVDLKVWVENMRGSSTESAVATVSLLSKESPNKTLYS
jgi:acyl dehydratase